MVANIPADQPPKVLPFMCMNSICGTDRSLVNKIPPRTRQDMHTGSCQQWCLCTGLKGGHSCMVGRNTETCLHSSKRSFIFTGVS